MGVDIEEEAKNWRSEWARFKGLKNCKNLSYSPMPIATTVGRLELVRIGKRARMSSY